MVAAKGHRILLQALAMLESRGQAFTCKLIGDGPERCALESLGARLGIAGRLRFMGAIAHQQTLSLVSEADVFVLASFAEGLPVALMEAMALGIPCVSTTIAGIPELIKNGENGLLTAPSNVHDLCFALERLAKNPDLRRHLGKNARAEVEERYNLASNLDRLAETWARRLGDHS
jgi:glycosyltransferase involved in cell wall biosynthesis